MRVCFKTDNRSNPTPVGFFRVVFAFFKIVLVVIWFVNSCEFVSCVFVNLKFCRSNSLLVKSLVLINFLYNTFFCFMDWSMPLVNQGLDRLFISLWLNFSTGACMSSCFVISSRNFLYDKSTSCLQLENTVSQSIIFRSERKFCSLKFLKFLWKISFLEF